jgi:hypothetical protein
MPPFESFRGGSPEKATRQTEFDDFGSISRLAEANQDFMIGLLRLPFAFRSTLGQREPESQFRECVVKPNPAPTSRQNAGNEFDHLEGRVEHLAFVSKSLWCRQTKPESRIVGGIA